MTRVPAGAFNHPVTIRIQFDPSVVNGAEVAVFYYDEQAKQWVKIPTTIEGNTAIATVSHFTKFAVFAVKETPTPPPPNQGGAFADTAGHWAETLIKTAVGQGWVKGYPDRTFHPNEAVTRAQFAVLLAKALGLAVPNGTAALSFADAASIPDWARPFVAACVQAGILHGYEDGTFRAEARISRAEMAVMVARALRLTADSGAGAGFADDGAIPAWAKPYVAAVKQVGLMQGRGGNRFEPAGITTRAEAVAVLLRMLEHRDNK